MKSSAKAAGPMAASVLLILTVVTLCHLVAANGIGPGTRSDHCAFTRQNTLYIFGGNVVGSEPLPTTYTTFSSFSSLTFPLDSNSTKLQWNDLPSGNSFNIVNGACGVTDNGYAIMLGYDPSEPISQAPGLQIYNINDQSWINSVELNSTVNFTQAFGQRQGMASAMWAGSIYFVFGGSVSKNATQDMFVLDTRIWPWSLSQLALSESTPAPTDHSTMIATSKYIYHFDTTDSPNDDGSYQTTLSTFDPVGKEWIDSTKMISTPYPVSFVATNDSTILMIPKNGNYAGPTPQKDGSVHQLLVESMIKHLQTTNNSSQDTNAPTADPSSSGVLIVGLKTDSHGKYRPAPVSGSTVRSNSGGSINNILDHSIILYGGKAEHGASNQLVVYDTLTHDITNSVANVATANVLVNTTSNQDNKGDGNSYSAGKLDRNLIGLCIALAVAGLTAVGLIALLFARRRQMKRDQENKAPVAEPVDDNESLTPVSPDFRRFSLLKEHDDAVIWSDKVRNMLTGIGATTVSPNEILRRQSQKSRSAKIAQGFYKRKDNTSQGTIKDASLQVSASMLTSGCTERQTFSNLASPSSSRFREHFEEKGRCVSGISEASAYSVDGSLLRTTSYHIGLEIESNTQAPSLVRSMSEYKALSEPGSAPLTSCGGVFSDMTDRTSIPPSSRRSW
ncbi:unnamed protein product [Umbelopsis vinacea]